MPDYYNPVGMLNTSPIRQMFHLSTPQNIFLTEALKIKINKPSLKKINFEYIIHILKCL